VTTTKPRVAVDELADDLGFGRVVRLHRQRRELLLGLVTLGLALLPAGGAAAVLIAEEHSSLWRLPVLGYALLLWATAAWLWWAPVPDQEPRTWFAVTEGGLIVWSADPDRRPRAIPWGGLRLEPRSVDEEWLTWLDEKGRKRGRTIPPVSGRRDLYRAVRRGGPVAPLSTHRVAAVTSFGLASVLALWFAVLPLTAGVLLGHRPEHITELRALCDGGGGFGRAAAYEGAGPHPIAVYGDIDFPDYTAGQDAGPDGWPAPDAVQLVGCAYLTDRTPITSCPYEGGYTVALSQGHYRVEVLEARTGRLVATVSIAGDADLTCSEYILVHPDTPKDDTDETRPLDADYAEHLSALVDGDAR
jgi:hypothetical protein